MRRSVPTAADGARLTRSGRAVWHDAVMELRIVRRTDHFDERLPLLGRPARLAGHPRVAGRRRPGPRPHLRLRRRRPGSSSSSTPASARSTGVFRRRRARRRRRAARTHASPRACTIVRDLRRPTVGPPQHDRRSTPPASRSPSSSGADHGRGRSGHERPSPIITTRSSGRWACSSTSRHSPRRSGCCD